MSLELDPLFHRVQEALAGRYSLDRELGRGGMGIVYLAHEVRLQRPVAIKLLPPAMAAQAPLRERFLREARTAARLSHPNIVPLHAVDEIADYVYYAMAYVPGETLARRVARKPFPVAEATRILRELAWALAYAHAQGVVHRDIKPENVILEQGTGRAMVTDFGIAAVEWDTRDTGPGQLLGTPEFMSPEQASGEAVDGRSDLYSVGALGYYLLSGKPPFQGTTAVKLLAQHLTAPIPSLAAMAPGVPEALAQILERCLAKEPDRRPGSGAQLADELGTILQAHPEPPPALRAVLRRFRLSTLTPGLVGLGPASMLLGAEIEPMVVRVAAMAAIWTMVAAAYFLYDFDVQLKQLRETGNGTGDVADAADVLARSRLEEESFLSRWAPYRSSPKVVRRGLWIGFGLFLVTGGWILLDGGSRVDYFALVILATASIIQIRRLEGFRHPPGTRKSLSGRFWRSRFVAWRWRRLIGETPEPHGALGHRPTEIRLGLTVDELFAALPLDARRQLRQVPPLVRRLEARTQSVRRRMEELDRLQAQAGRGGEAGAALADRTALLADLGASRAAAGARLEQLVAALETIRLDLLRLRAGAATVEGITADLAPVAEMAAQPERLLAAQEKVERPT